MTNTNFKSREKKFQKIWEGQNWHKGVDFDKIKKEKKYILVEFPYPSGSGLHMGHAFTMTGADVYVRKNRMDNKNVLFPMGWDSFGLPTENYAIRTGISPQKATKDNTDNFRKQMKKMAFSFDWDREVGTTDPSYYHWTQWIFVQLFKYGLAYKEEKAINWCPSCKTGLANEEVVDGKCERCGAQVSKKNLSQWIVKITDYADRLIDGLEKVDFIPKVKAVQINWIGKSQGVTIDYPLVSKEGIISCYSTRPDTNFGATFVVIAPEHNRVMELTTEDNKQAVADYIKQAKKKSELERTELSKEKTGVFTGSYCLNRLTNKKMPIYVADFVVLTAGTGIVVGVPAHDKRDWDFAKKYDLEIVPVIKPSDGKDWDFEQDPFVDIDDAQVFNSGFLDGMPALKAKDVITDHLVEKKWGERAVNFHLRDWIFSRQHYWGEPIPMVFCSKCANEGISYFEAKNEEGKAKNNNEKRKSFKISEEVRKKTVGFFPVEDDQLPVELPEVGKYQPTDTGESPLAIMTDWVSAKCPHCGGPAKRETDTMPNWAGSDWYFLAYCFANKLNKSEIRNPKSETNSKLKIENSQNIFSESKDALSYWMPVDVYIGGDEHNTLHLLYSRFICQFLWDIGVLPESIPEPYNRRISHGVILGTDNQKMSKSKGNTIEPDEIIGKYGVDAARTYMMFMGPFTATMAWNDNALRGVARFLEKFEGTLKKVKESPISKEEEQKTEGAFLRLLNQSIKKIGDDIDTFHYNTAVSQLMILLNILNKSGQAVSLIESEPRGFKRKISKGSIKKIIRLLAPFAPYLAEDLWQGLVGEEGSVHASAWPKIDEQYLIEERIQIVVQVNGKVRAMIELETNEAKDQKIVEEKVKLEANVTKYLKGKKIIKTIFVPDRLINFVIKAF